MSRVLTLHLDGEDSQTAIKVTIALGGSINGLGEHMVQKIALF
jgi:hypothetical protein